MRKSCLKTKTVIKLLKRYFILIYLHVKMFSNYAVFDLAKFSSIKSHSAKLLSMKQLKLSAKLH